MVTAVFVIGVLNLALGAGLAIIAEKPWQLMLPTWKRRTTTSDMDEVVDETAQVDQDWLQPLQEARLSADSQLEKLLWVMHLELRRLRAELEPVDCVLHDPDHPQFLDGQMCDTLDPWVARLEMWASVLENATEKTEYQQVADQLDEMLLDLDFEARQIGDVCEAKAKEYPLPLTELRRQVVRLYRTFDTLRTFVDSQLGSILREEEHLQRIDENRRVDEGSGAYSRLGLETLFADWWARDESRVRILSCLLVDVDRMAKVNEEYGPVAGDRILDALGEVFRNLVRKERGFDRVVRYTGQSYLLFFGDTAVGNATNGAERIRQTIEVTSFQFGESSIELTTSMGVAEVGKRESLADFLARLERTVTEAKDAGRNRIAVHTGSGVKFDTPPQYQVERREIIVEFYDSLLAAMD